MNKRAAAAVAALLMLAQSASLADAWLIPKSVEPIRTPVPTASPEPTAAPEPEASPAPAAEQPSEAPAGTETPAAEQDGVLTVSYQGKVFAPVDATYVDFGSTPVRDFKALTAFLDQLPDIKKVDMFKTTMRKQQCDQLAERYPWIEWGWTIRFAEHTVRTDMTAFSTLHYSGAQTHSSEMLSVLKYCTHLMALDIGHNGAQDLSFLYDLPHLRILIIACNKVTDLTPLASLHELEYLEVFSNYVTDLTPLSGLDHLMDLNIAYNNITDFTPLYGLTGLKRLWIFHATNRKGSGKVDPVLLEGLQQALPDTHIDATHMPTEGGWRDHPHFDILHTMMRDNIYKPFADSH